MRPPASSKAYDAEQRSRSRPTVGTRTGCQNQHLLSSGGAAINSISTSTAIQKHFALSIAFAHSTMDKANNYTRKWTRERAPHKANGIRSSIASDTYAYRRLRQPGAITESAPDTEVTTTGAASAAETPVVLTETQKIEKILTDRIAEQCTMTQIDRITINDDLGTEADGNYIALVYLTWDQKNIGMLPKYLITSSSKTLTSMLLLLDFKNLFNSRR